MRKNWETPYENESDLEVRPPGKVAGGIPAVVSTFKHIIKQMGMRRGIASLLKLNQKSGVDCPGCAWPEPNERSMAEFCENGAKAIAEEATLSKVEPSFFKKYSIDELAKKSDYWLSQQGRITTPMVLRDGQSKYQTISWNDAFSLIGEKLNQLDHPNQAIFYTSGRTSNEAAFLYQLFARVLGTNNMPDCSNMCHESSGVALSETIGIGKGSVTLEDFEKADCILVIGQNPGTNHPRMLTTLEKAAERGCEIITINPLKEVGTERFIHPKNVHRLLGGGTELTSLFLQVKINGDVALLKGLMKELIARDKEESLFDREFIENHTSHYDEFIKALEEASWQQIYEQSGVERDQIAKAANILAKSKKIIACWAMGLTQHKNAVANIQEVVNLLMLKGCLGKEGAGVCPVRGHSNVQGDRTMGIHEAPSLAFLESLEREFNFSVPKEHGFNTVEAIKAMNKGQASVFMSMGGNFLSASPDTEFTASALRKMDLSVHVSTKLNRAHLITGKTSLILPCLGRTEVDKQKGVEQILSVENSMSIVHSTQGHLRPCSSHLKSEVSIICGMGRATFKKDKEKIVDWDKFESHYDLIRDAIEKVIPGFENFNKRLREENGFYLPHPARGKRDFKRIAFSIHPMTENKLEKDEYLMMTIRTHDQFNTTIYGLHDRYRGISYGRRVVLMNKEDMKKANLSQGSMVNISSDFEGVKRLVEKFFTVEYNIPKGCVATYFPEANPLIPINSYADKSFTPTSKSVVVKIARSL